MHVVAGPPDLIERLLAVSANGIVAPHVRVERIDPHQAPSGDNGGWFYDIGAFIKDGQRRHMWRPELPGVQEMEAVGTCYLMPANLWRRGARYDPVRNEIDHLSLMRQARALGYRIWATEDATVEHAYLPHYGEDWHRRPS